MQEVFKDVPGWAKYQVSNKGRIRRKAGYDTVGRYWPERFKQPKRPDYYVVLVDGARKWDGALARLVLLTFVGPPPYPDSQARHLDDVRSNNCLSNLAWGSCLENHQDRVRNGRTTKGRPRSAAVRAKISLAQKGKKIPKHVIEKIRATKLSQKRKLTDEHKEKIRRSVTRTLHAKRKGASNIQPNKEVTHEAVQRAIHPRDHGR